MPAYSANQSIEGAIFRTHYPSKNFSALGGYEEILEEVSYLVDYLKGSPAYANLGISAPKGVIISGPSGVGKTLLAEAIAGQAGVPFIVINAAELQSSCDRNPECNLADMFEQAKAMAPCVVCLDDVEAIARNSEEIRPCNPLQFQLLNLLANEHLGIVVLATTEDVEVLNPAIMRPGRFDRHINLELPTRQERKKIFQKLLQGKPMAEDVSLDDICMLTWRFSGAELIALINEAGLAAIKEKCEVLHARHFDWALMQMIEGSVKTNFQDSAARRLTAAHESGHAIVGHLLGRKIYKISVLPAQSSWGRTIYIPPEAHSYTKEDMANQICVGLAGRAAEILMDTPAMGCADDFRKAKAIAKDMIHKEAMGKTMLGQEDEVEEILQAQLARAIQILKENYVAWEQLREALVLQGQVTRPEFLKIVTSKPSLKDVRRQILRAAIRQAKQWIELPALEGRKFKVFFDFIGDLGWI